MSEVAANVTRKILLLTRGMLLSHDKLDLRTYSLLDGPKCLTFSLVVRTLELLLQMVTLR